MCDTTTFAGVNFPPELIKSQKDGDLIIFAGSGVSMGPPALMPDLRKLSAIAAEQLHSDLRTEPKGPHKGDILDLLQIFDHASSGFVHQVAKGIYSEDKEPNEIHFYLTLLFKESRIARIITTNYDLLFQKAAKRLSIVADELSYPDLLIESSSLAMSPVESQSPTSKGRFAGIAHLHGVASGKSSDLILLKKDFKRAYVAGSPRAKNFLLEVLNKPAVLFVGYGVNDPHIWLIFEEVAISNPRMYALCPLNEGVKWNNLGIKPLWINAPHDEDTFQNLNSVLREWIEYNTKSKVRWDKDVVPRAPQLEPRQNTSSSAISSSGVR